ncbi:hypothetical protein LCGC14_1986450 [marine sediment metagenome]|uniref:Uncharacterized protein n=1 Tax=marine sediment metagenome TaxID=412755 RepID=A0A0F9F7D1_9ZZZZ
MSVTDRVMGVIITGEAVSALAREGKRTIEVSSGVPETATFFKSWFDHSRNFYVAAFEDESFDPVEAGCEIPLLPCQCSITELKKET